MNIQLKFSPILTKIFNKKSHDEIERLINYRIETIGPIPRFVFAEKDAFNQYLLQLTTNSKNLWSEIDKLDVFKPQRPFVGFLFF